MACPVQIERRDFVGNFQEVDTENKIQKRLRQPEGDKKRPGRVHAAEQRAQDHADMLRFQMHVRHPLSSRKSNDCSIPRVPTGDDPLR